MPDTIKVGKTLKLSPKWSSANNDVASVSLTGVVKAVSPGVTEIYCAIGNEVAAIHTVRVEEK